EMARLVDAVLKAEGFSTILSKPGPDGGVDILAARGSLGFDHPALCVQVKSSDTPADVKIFRELVGTMETHQATHGLLVCWGGFNQAVLKESKSKWFKVRFWDQLDLVE